MPINIPGYLLGRIAAEQAGAARRRASQLAILPAVSGFSLPVGVLVTQAIARREVPAIQTSTGTPPSGSGESSSDPSGTTKPPATNGVKIIVPSLINQEVSYAYSLAKEFNLTPIVIRVQGKKVDGMIYQQNPHAGEVVNHGTEIELYTGAGTPMKSVPLVKGLPIKEAIEKLSCEGFQVVEQVSVLSDDMEKGKVKEQIPQTGEWLSSCPVTLVVGLGKGYVEMPDYCGRLLSDVENDIPIRFNELGFKLCPTVWKNHAAKQDTVFWQFPKAGCKLTSPPEIKLFVSMGPCSIVVNPPEGKK